MSRILTTDEAGRDLTFDELHALLGAYGIDLWQRYPVTTEEEAVAAGERLGWDVVLKATADHLRQRPDLAHVWRNIDNEAEMRDAWQTMQELIESPESGRLHRAAGRRARRARSRSAGMEDPLFGPVVSFGVSGPATELLGDRSYRIPPMHSGDASRHGPRDPGRAAAVRLPGQRGGRRRRRSSTCCCGSPSSRTTCRRSARSSSTWCSSAPTGATVLNAVGRVEPVADARSDWFVRRLSTQAGDTLHG